MATGKNRRGAKMRYYDLKKGNVTRRVPEGTPDSFAVGNGKYETQDDFITGIIRKALFEPSDNPQYSGKLNFIMEDDEGLFQLSTGWKGGYMMDFLAKFRNIDFTKEIKFEPYFIQEEGKRDGYYLGVFQNDQKIKKFFTKDDHADVPRAVAPSGPGEKWSFEAQEKFLINAFTLAAFPIFEQTLDAAGWEYGSDANRVVPKEEPAPAASNENAAASLDEEMDGLPF